MKKHLLSALSLFLIISFLVPRMLLAQDTDDSQETEEIVEKNGKKEKVIIKYKKFEKFDLDDLDVEGSKSKDSNLSVQQRDKINFQNKLPSRDNFDNLNLREMELLN